MEEAFSPEVLGCTLERWAVFWGDPLVPAVFSMLAYGLGGMVLLRAARRTEARDRRLWYACAALFFLQVVNTHLDLHALPGAYGRCLALAQGWYAERGPVKMLGLALIGAAAAAAVAVAAVAWWRSIRGNIVLVAGVAIALGLTLVRGAGVTVAEEAYSQPLGPFRLGDVAEFGGVALAVVAGWQRLRLLRRACPERPQAAR